MALALVALALPAAGCGADRKTAPGAPGTIAVYSSIPSKGVLAGEGRAIAAGQHAALRDAGARAGGRRVRLVELDSAGDAKQPWDPGLIESNARRASDDPTAMAYLGEVGLGGSAVSVPVTNAKGLLQVSPGDGLPSLTQPEPGGGAQVPARYYPSGKRTFIRLVPQGGLEGRRLVDWARRRGARSVAVVRDQGVYGAELSSWLLDAAKRERIPVQAGRARPGADYQGLARDMIGRHPGAVILAMEAGEDADRVVAALRQALPSVPVLATSGVAGHPPAGVDYLSAFRRPSDYSPAAQRLLRRIGPFGVEALYGYEAMRLVLDSIARVRPHGPADRPKVVAAATGLRRVRGAFGPYSLAPGGDVAGAVFGSYRSSGAAAPRPLGDR
ncbi:MAG: branched-chain amino acid transport system substrate-binding protein [Thermoleophilaceae bacterium]|nr:branched-chain amino acid transport system substrate-binding protein [Thermoleophilaceae bacterium]